MMGDGGGKGAEGQYSLLRSIWGKQRGTSRVRNHRYVCRVHEKGGRRLPRNGSCSQALGGRVSRLGERECDEIEMKIKAE